LLNYFKYAATIDGGLFSHTFGFTPRYGLKEIFAHYRNLKTEVKMQLKRVEGVASINGNLYRPLWVSSLLTFHDNVYKLNGGLAFCFLSSAICC
jgi:hypothetical protein